MGIVNETRIRARRRPSPRGFTLLELVVVLSLAGVLAALGIVAHRAVREQLVLWQAARQVALHLNLTRLRAIRENADHRLRFAVGGREYRQQRLEHGAFVDAAPPAQLPRGAVVAACNAPEDAIRFRPRGNALQFGTVKLRNGRDQERHVVVSMAGSVRVE